MHQTRNKTVSPLIAIVGETASGKTALGIELAKRFDGEIICADSRTVYRSMDIGTAKPTTAEQVLVPHHLLDIVNPDQQFTVADFQRLATEAIDDVTRRGKLPIMVGGSGLYVDAVIYQYAFSSPTQARNPNNPRHLAAEARRADTSLRPHTLVLGLESNRETLTERISQRVHAMVQAGLVEETRMLLAQYRGSKALDAPGYKAFAQYIAGDIDLETAKAIFVRNDLGLAKRQRTWFKRNKSIHWVNNSSDAVEFTTTFLDNL